EERHDQPDSLKNCAAAEINSVALSADGPDPREQPIRYTWRPSALAVVRLITTSNLVGYRVVGCGYPVTAEWSPNDFLGSRVRKSDARDPRKAKFAANSDDS